MVIYDDWYGKGHIKLMLNIVNIGTSNQLTGERVSSAELMRNFSHWQNRAANGPLIVTYHGKPRYVLVTADAWQAANAAPGEVAAVHPTRELEYQFLVEHMDGGLILADANLVVHEASSAAALLVHRLKDDLLGRKLSEVLPQSMTGSAVSDLWHVLRTGEQTQFDLPYGVPGNGRLRIRAFPWLEGIALIMRVFYEGDEDARLAEHEALEKARAAHGAIQVLRLSVRATVTMVEAAFAQITGLNRERILGVRFADLLDLKDRARARDALERVLGGHAESEVLDVLLLDNKGDKLPVRIAITPLAEGFGIGGAMLVMTFEQPAG